MAELQRVKIKGLTDKVYNFEVDRSSTIAQVKQKLCADHGLVTIDTFILIFKGKILENNKLLSEYNIGIDETIFLRIDLEKLYVQIQIKTITGHTITEKVNRASEIRSVMVNIEDKIGLEKQRLIFNGTKLDLNKTVDECQITDGSVLELAQTEEHPLHIQVRTITNFTIKVDIDASRTVADLKKKIEQLSEIPANKQRLICKGRSLRDTDKLSEYNIDEQSPVHLVVVKTGPVTMYY